VRPPIISRMNLERFVERLRNYRLENESFDRLVGAVLANKQARKAARAVVSAATSGVRTENVLKPGHYDTVFFVAGEMRSGTTWVQRILSAHPEVSCSHEGSFFGRDYDHEEIPVYTGPVSSLTRVLAVSDEFRVWHELPWNTWADGYEEDARNLMRLSIDYFLAKEVARRGRRIVGDKSPQHTENLDEIHEIYPDARIIHVVRDGRDVAVSAMHHWWRLAQDREDGMFELTPEELEIRDACLADREGFLRSGRSIFTEERLGQLARRWSHRVTTARRVGPNLYGEGYLELRYEDLQRGMPTQLRRVFEFLGAHSDPKVIERCIRAGSFERAVDRRSGEEDPTSPIRKGISGDWRTVFTERDRALYKELAGECLAELGYDKSGDW